MVLTSLEILTTILLEYNFPAIAYSIMENLRDNMLHCLANALYHSN